MFNLKKYLTVILILDKANWLKCTLKVLGTVVWTQCDCGGPWKYAPSVVTHVGKVALTF